MLHQLAIIKESSARVANARKRHLIELLNYNYATGARL